MISHSQLQQIGDFVNRQEVLSDLMLNDLRENFAGIHFTFCCDDDVGQTHPVYEQDSYNLYLIDSRNHCLCFTQDFDIATGVVIAELEDE